MNRFLLFVFDVARAAEGTEGAGVEGDMGVWAIIPNLIAMAGIFAVFYFLLIRPQRKKEKAVKKMLADLKVGDRVTTIGGMFGTVTAMKDDVITVAIGPQKVQLVVARWGIRSVDTIDIQNEAEALN